MTVARGEGGKGVHRHRGCGFWLGTAVGVWLSLAGAAISPARAEPETKVPPKTKPARAGDVAQEMAALLDAHRTLAANMAQLRDQVEALQRSLSGAQDEIRESRDLLQAAMEQIKGMREEVRGLYVESSGLKGDIAQLGKQVEGLEGNLGSFRLNSGILLAVVLVLQLTLVALTFRGRGQ